MALGLYDDLHELFRSIGYTASKVVAVRVCRTKNREVIPRLHSSTAMATREI